MALSHEVRLAWRSLLKDRSFLVFAVGALALGVAANSTFFALANAAVIRGLPIDHPGRVLFIGTRDAQDRPAGLSYGEYRDLASGNTVFDQFGAYSTAPMVVGDDAGAADRVTGAYVSAGTLPVLETPPALGRPLRAADDEPGAAPVVLLGDRVWKRRYAGDPAIVGRTVRIDGGAATVIGVMPEGFRFPATSDLWRPLAAMRPLAAQPRAARTLSVIGRLRDGATTGAARMEMAAFRTQWQVDFPATYRGISMAVTPINEQLVGRVTDRVWVAFLTVGVLVLLIACANVGNLLLMRGVARQRELAVRASIGASRWQIVRQLLVENCVLAVVATACGGGLAYAALTVLSATFPADALPYWFRITMDGRVLAMLIAACAGSVLVFGIAPAVHQSRVDLNRELHAGGRTVTTGPGVRRATAVFLCLEFALTLALAAAVAGNIRNSAIDRRVEYPFESASLLTVSVTLPAERYATAAVRQALFDDVHEQMVGLSGVETVTFASAMPRSGGVPVPLEIAGRPNRAGEPPPSAVSITVGERYFAALGVPMVRGAGFGPLDGTAGHEAAIVNRQFAERFFPNDDPIGHLIRVGTSDGGSARSWLRIVGVSPTLRQRLVSDPVVYVPFRAAAPATTGIILRTKGNPSDIAASVRDVFARRDSDIAVYRIMSMDESIAQSEWTSRFSNQLFDSLAAVALLLALVGVYAVTTHAVEQRQHELSIRSAVGAAPSALRRLMLGATLRQLLAGTIVGVPATAALGRLLSDPASPAHATDIVVMAPVICALLVVALVACLGPVRRAVAVDPSLALRES